MFLEAQLFVLWSLGKEEALKDQAAAPFNSDLPKHIWVLPLHV